MILSTLQTVGILVGIAYYIMSLRNQEKARQAQLIARLYDKYSDPEFTRRLGEVWNRQWDNIDDYLQKYGPNSDEENRINYVLMMNFFESFGVYLKHGLIDSEVLYEQMPTNAIFIWDKFEEVIKYYRESNNYPQYARPLEYLADEMKKIARSRGDPVHSNYYKAFRRTNN